jgi:hypothetical protein
MKTINIIFSDSSSCELRDIDHLGRYISKEDFPRFGVLIPMSFQLDNYSLNARLELWIDKSKLPDKHQKESVLALASRTCPQFLAERKELNVFQTINFNPFIEKEIVQEIKEKSYETSVKVNISEEFYSSLNEQKARDKATRDAFNCATKILYNFACNLTSYGFKYSADDIRELINYISYCLENSESLSLASWNSEKLHGLRPAFEELIRRKVENNRNYRYAQDKAREITYMLKPPHFWYGEPPCPERVGYIIQKHSKAITRENAD